ncbi:MAG: cold-shock protein, partial [Mycobacteriales bacterium]
GEDVFAHVRSFAEGLTWLVEGDRVAFEVVQGEKGPQARNLQLVSSAALTAAPASRGGEGVVARYDAERGFGFITPDAGGPDLFVHFSVVVDGQPLTQGERVSFKVRQSDKGPQADRVERL